MDTRGHLWALCTLALTGDFEKNRRSPEISFFFSSQRPLKEGKLKTGRCRAAVCAGPVPLAPTVGYVGTVVLVQAQQPVRTRERLPGVQRESVQQNGEEGLSAKSKPVKPF